MSYALRALTPTTKGLDWRTPFAKATQLSYVPSCPIAISNNLLLEEELESSSKDVDVLLYGRLIEVEEEDLAREI
jgi:hypothetical protein